MDLNALKDLLDKKKIKKNCNKEEEEEKEKEPGEQQKQKHIHSFIFIFIFLFHHFLFSFIYFSSTKKHNKKPIWYLYVMFCVGGVPHMIFTILFFNKMRHIIKNNNKN